MFIIISTRSRIIITEFKSLSTILQRLIVDVYEWQSEWQWLLLIAGNSLTLIDEFSNRIQWYNLTRKSSCMNFSTASSHTLWQRVSCSRENRWLCGDRTQHPCPNHRTHIQLYTAEKHRTIEKASQVLVRRNTCIYIYIMAIGHITKMHMPTAVLTNSMPYPISTFQPLAAHTHCTFPNTKYTVDLLFALRRVIGCHYGRRCVEIYSHSRCSISHSPPLHVCVCDVPDANISLWTKSEAKRKKFLLRNR